MKVFKDNEIDKKLNKQIEFGKDNNKIDTILGFEEKLINSLRENVDGFRELFTGYKNYVSKENAGLFKSVYASFEKFERTFLKVDSMRPLC